MNIADRIKSLRKAKGISQEELADQVGVSRQAISKWESGQSVPDIDKIIFISDYFEVTTDYILRGIEPVSATDNETSVSLYVGFSIVCATILGVWSFTANRFRFDECLFLSLAGAVIGIGVGYITQAVISLSKKEA